MTHGMHEIDFDEEKVRIDDAWLDAAGVEERIGQAYAARQFVQVGKLGTALEALTHAVAGAQMVTMKLAPAQFAELEAQSRASGRTLGQVARERLFRNGPYTPNGNAAPPAEGLSAADLGLVPKRREDVYPAAP